jgi:hypothetical protein
MTAMHPSPRSEYSEKWIMEMPPILSLRSTIGNLRPKISLEQEWQAITEA